MRSLIKGHYHWIIAMIVLLEMFSYVGILNNINGLYVIPVSEALGITRGDYSLAFSAKALAGALSVVLSGPLLRRYGYRKMASGFLAVATAAFFVLCTCRNLVMLYLGAIMIGVCEGTCLTAGATFIIGSWFHRYRGSVLGCVTAATGIGGSAMCILLTHIIDSVGWRASYAACAIISAVMGLLVAMFIRDHPGTMGLKPFGAGELPVFGYCAHNTSNGIFLAMPAAAGMIASPLTNMVYDKTGTYLPAFEAAMLLSVAVLALHILICVLAKQNRKRLEQ